MPRQLPPTALKVGYFSQLRKRVKAMHEKTMAALAPLIPAKTDADEGPPIKAVLRHIAQQVSKTTFNTDELETVVSAYFKSTSDFQRKQLTQQISAITGFDPFIKDANLNALAEQWVKENVSLIKSIPERYFDQVGDIVKQGLQEGQRWEDMADDLTDRLGVAESNAQRIARDQVGKLTGDLNSERQQELGIDSFIWRTVHDNRVREEHAHLDGQTFAWDDPPEDEDTGEEIIPGSAINCRCFGEPSLDHLLQSDE